MIFFFFKQKTAYEMRISDWSSDVCSSDLVARNARRHADNPEFRADMIATLEESVGKMNDMLARLSQHNRARYEEPRAVALRSLAENVVAIKGQQHPVILSGDAVVLVMADPVRLEQRSEEHKSEIQS